MMLTPNTIATAVSSAATTGAARCSDRLKCSAPNRISTQPHHPATFRPASAATSVAARATSTNASTSARHPPKLSHAAPPCSGSHDNTPASTRNTPPATSGHRPSFRIPSIPRPGCSACTGSTADASRAGTHAPASAAASPHPSACTTCHPDK